MYLSGFQNYCSVMDANLVKIESQRENNFLVAEIKKLHPGNNAIRACVYCSFTSFRVSVYIVHSPVSEYVCVLFIYKFQSTCAY